MLISKFLSAFHYKFNSVTKDNRVSRNTDQKTKKTNPNTKNRCLIKTPQAAGAEAAATPPTDEK